MNCAICGGTKRDPDWDGPGPETNAPPCRACNGTGRRSTEYDDLVNLRAGWDHAAREDAMFNILTYAEKAGNKWDPDDFFAMGELEITNAMAKLDRLTPDRPRTWAVDFGCGVGRLTQALMAHYAVATGVDISPEMIRLAEGYNRFPRRCAYRVCDASGTLPLPDGHHDLVYTNITLQHMPRERGKGYVAEFCRILRPGGVAMLVCPEGPDYGLTSYMSIENYPRDQVESWLRDGGMEVVDVEPMDTPPWVTNTYVARKAA